MKEFLYLCSRLYKTSLQEWMQKNLVYSSRNNTLPSRIRDCNDMQKPATRHTGAWSRN